MIQNIKTYIKCKKSFKKILIITIEIILDFLNIGNFLLFELLGFYFFNFSQKFRNILLTEQDIVKLADFGSSAIKCPANTFVGTAKTLRQKLSERKKPF